MSKSITVWLSILLLAFVFTSCSNKNSKTKTPPVSQSPTPASTVQNNNGSGNKSPKAKTPPVNQSPAPASTVQNSNTESKFYFTAYDVDGTLRNSNKWVGKEPVVINFWGTWCPPCRREIPDLVKVYNEYHPKGIEILGLAVKDQPKKVKRFAQQKGMNWVMLMADTDLAMRYHIRGVPTTIFIDRNGKEVGRFVGPRDYKTFKEAFEKLLQN
ncbi:MAG: redoxin domain-containing protein [FCB group bacterium]|nr:redoxin domain-containing protein [FCB group bacterium]